MPSLTADSTPAITNKCAWQAVEDSAVVIDLDARRVMGLNPVATHVWKSINGKKTVATIAAEVAQRFEVNTPQATDDVSAFLNGMLNRGLISI